MTTHTYLETYQPAKALDCFRPALDMARELEDPRFVALTMTNLGATLVFAKKEPMLAVEMLENAPVIATDLDDWQSRFAVRAHLERTTFALRTPCGSANSPPGTPSQGGDRKRAVRDPYPPLGKGGFRGVLRSRFRVYATQPVGALADALALADRPDGAMELARLQHSEAARIGYTKFEVDALQTIGDVHLARCDSGAVEASFETMLQIPRDRSDRSAEGKALSAMAGLALYRGGQGDRHKDP